MMSNPGRKDLCVCLQNLQLGGGESAMTTMMNHLVEESWDVTLLLFEKKGEMLNRLDNRIKVVSLDASRSLIAVLRLIRYLRKNKPKKIMSSSVQINPLLLFAKSISRIDSKVILRVGSPLSIVFSGQKGLKNKTIHFLTYLLYRKADRVIAVSEGIADDIVSFAGVQRSKISVIYTPKDVDLINSRANEKVPDIFEQKEGPFVVSVGRLTKQKDFPTLVKSFSIVCKKIPSAQLIIIGDGSGRKKIEALIRELHLDKNVTLAGFQENPYVFMKNSDVFVLASLWEGLPNVLIEALICETKIVATDAPMGGSREILDPQGDYSKRIKSEIKFVEYGILTPIADQENLAKAITASLDQGKVKKIPWFLTEDVFKLYRDILLSA